MKGFQLLSGLQCRENVIQDDQSYSAFVFLKLYGADEFNQIVSQKLAVFQLLLVEGGKNSERIQNLLMSKRQ